MHTMQTIVHLPNCPLLASSGLFAPQLPSQPGKAYALKLSTSHSIRKSTFSTGPKTACMLPEHPHSKAGLRSPCFDLGNPFVLLADDLHACCSRDTSTAIAMTTLSPALARATKSTSRKCCDLSTQYNTADFIMHALKSPAGMLSGGSCTSEVKRLLRIPAHTCVAHHNTAIMSPTNATQGNEA